MFGTKKEENQKNNYELQVENEKLKIQSETLQFKLEQMNEKYSVLEKQLREARDISVEKIKAENESLKKEITDLKFKISTDTTQIEVETENKKLKQQWKEALNYPILPYPKGDNENYELGRVYSQVLIDKDKNIIHRENEYVMKIIT